MRRYSCFERQGVCCMGKQRAESELRMFSLMITVSLLVELCPRTGSRAYHGVVVIQINVDPGVIGYGPCYILYCLTFHRCYTQTHNLQANGFPLDTNKIRKLISKN